MTQTYRNGRFEFFVIVIVISIVSLAAVGRYSLMAEEARVLRLEIISHHFMTGAANARVEYLLNNVLNKTRRSESLSLSNVVFYFSAQGWPVTPSGPVAPDYQPNIEDCYRLWQSLLQNPARISIGKGSPVKTEYLVVTYAGRCRYSFTDGSAHFDYSPLDGKLLFSSP